MKYVVRNSQQHYARHVQDDFAMVRHTVPSAPLGIVQANTLTEALAKARTLWRGDLTVEEP